jgi:peptidoglycan hydrolase-like protein with peptidoglycan-binding domain
MDFRSGNRDTLYRSYSWRYANTMALTSTQLAGSPALQKAANNAPPIRYGASNEGVAAMQRGLIDAGFPMPRSTRGGIIPPDGMYGQETGQVLRQFQRDNALAADGVAGRQTLGRLDELLRSQPSYNAAAENIAIAQQLSGARGSRPFAATTARRT